ncbi:GWxTD domain-containing protein [candidate division KSB1 bacterium]|nr:GWxTD domain-containing protein [candidate division KSB1 bacterium]
MVPNSISAGLFALLAISIQSSAQSPARAAFSGRAVDHRDYYGEGIKLKISGDWRKALAAWALGKEALATQGESDPRVGIAFIELAAEQSATAYYEQACDLYDWGFSQADPKEYEHEIATEIERTAPILAEDDYKTWRSDLEKGNPALNAKIRNFWIEKDPTPTTKTNERLVEHWERIAYARKSFKKAGNTIYGTDDRGLIHVKYGKPDRKNLLVLGNRLDEIEGLRELYNLSPEAMALIKSALRNYLAFAECEIWVYHSLNEKEPVIYVFGQEAGRGFYGLRNGVEEFIPDEAFRGVSSRYTAGILPGALLQLMYYNDLYAFDDSFAERYDELKSIWFRSSHSNRFPNDNIVRGVRNKFELADADNPARRFAPVDRSDAGNAIPIIQVSSYPARFLDDRNQPELVFVAFAFPQGLGNRKPVERLHESAKPDYRIHYTFIVRDREMDEVQRTSSSPIAEGDHTAVLTTPHQETQAHYTLAVEAFTQQSQTETGTPIGAGKDFFEKITPLDSNPQQLEVSDLVIGVEPPAGFEVGLLPYPVVPSRQIRKPDALKVYLEIYHLHLDDGGAGHFNIDFRVVKFERKGKKIARAEMIASAFDFQSTAPAAKESFTISVANLKAGEYELEVEVQDKISGMKKQRSAPFQIAKERQG